MIILTGKSYSGACGSNASSCWVLAKKLVHVATRPVEREQPPFATEFVRVEAALWFKVVTRRDLSVAARCVM